MLTFSLSLKISTLNTLIRAWSGKAIRSLVNFNVVYYSRLWTERGLFQVQKNQCIKRTDLIRLFVYKQRFDTGKYVRVETNLEQRLRVCSFHS